MIPLHPLPYLTADNAREIVKKSCVPNPLLSAPTLPSCTQLFLESVSFSPEQAISLNILRAFDMIWHPALLTKLSSEGIQGHLHSWLADFLSCRSQRVALNGVLTPPLPVHAGVPQGSVLHPVLFLVFINDLSDSLENPLYLFADDSTLCRTICHPSDWQAAASSLSADLEKNHKLVKHVEHVFQS